MYHNNQRFLSKTGLALKFNSFTSHVALNLNSLSQKFLIYNIGKILSTRKVCYEDKTISAGTQHIIENVQEILVAFSVEELDHKITYTHI